MRSSMTTASCSTKACPRTRGSWLTGAIWAWATWGGGRDALRGLRQWLWRDRWRNLRHCHAQPHALVSWKRDSAHCRADLHGGDRGRYRGDEAHFARTRISSSIRSGGGWHDKEEVGWMAMRRMLNIKIKIDQYCFTTWVWAGGFSWCWEQNAEILFCPADIWIAASHFCMWFKLFVCCVCVLFVTSWAGLRVSHHVFFQSKPMGAMCNTLLVLSCQRDSWDMHTCKYRYYRRGTVCGTFTDLLPSPHMRLNENVCLVVLCWLCNTIPRSYVLLWILLIFISIIWLWIVYVWLWLSIVNDFLLALFILWL